MELPNEVDAKISTGLRILPSVHCHPKKSTLNQSLTLAAARYKLITTAPMIKDASSIALIS